MTSNITGIYLVYEYQQKFYGWYAKPTDTKTQTFARSKATVADSFDQIYTLMNEQDPKLTYYINACHDTDRIVANIPNSKTKIRLMGF